MLLSLRFLSVTMAAPRKTCDSCSFEMHSMDQHPYCLQCLTATHDSANCSLCKSICYTIYWCRLGIVGDALQASKWPQGWREKLLKCEDMTWASTEQNVDDNSPDSSHEEDQVDKDETHVKVHLPTDEQWKSSMEATMAGLGVP